MKASCNTIFSGERSLSAGRLDIDKVYIKVKADKAIKPEQLNKRYVTFETHLKKHNYENMLNESY